MSMMVLTTCVHIQRALKKGTNFMPAYSLIRVIAIFVLPVKKEMKRRRNKSYSEKKIKQHKETSFTTSQFSRPHREPRFLSDGNHAIRNRLIFFFSGVTMLTAVFLDKCRRGTRPSECLHICPRGRPWRKHHVRAGRGGETLEINFCVL